MEIAIIVLGLVIAGLLVERYLFVKQINGVLGDSMKAIMSRNINEFLAAKTIDKAVENVKVEEDEVELSQASDEQFDKFIKEQVK